MFETIKERFKTPEGIPAGGSLPFASAMDSLKAKVAQIIENKRMGADLLFMNTYMASLALANVSRPEIFSYAAKRKEYISSKYIARADTFVKKWGYSYSQGLTIVSDRTSNELLRSMLSRYANAIDSGIPDDSFLSNELSTVRSVYQSQIEQGLELLKKWGDAYVAMLLSGTVIAVTMMISIAIYSPSGMQSTLNLAYAIILAICTCGNVLMFQSVPDDPKTHGLAARTSKEQQTIHAMERIIVPVAIMMVVLLVLLGINAGLIFLMIGVLMAPLAMIGYIDDQNITLRDSEFTTFIRSLGSVMGSQATPAVHALGSIERKSLVALGPFVNSAYSKMNLGLDDKQTWERFIGEAGSNLIYKYMNIFLDTVSLGGPPDPIGIVVGSSVLEHVLLRQKKDMHARSFIVLLIPMHIAMESIFVALYRIMVVLTGSVSAMMKQFQETSGAAGSAGAAVGGSLGGGLNMFTNFPEKEMGVFVVITLAIITTSNIIAARVVGGGDRYMFYFYTAIFCSLTGLVLMIVPVGVGLFFSPEGLASMAQAGKTAGGGI